MAKRHRPVVSDYQRISETSESDTDDDDVQQKVIRSRMKPHRSSQLLEKRVCKAVSSSDWGID